MKRSQGSILIIVVILVGALYLLASMMLIIHQQYFSDMLMARSGAQNRQKLLNIGHKNLQRMSKGFRMDESEIWPECDASIFPEMRLDEDILLRKMQLANHCYEGFIAHRIWLASSDQFNDRLVMDQLIEKEAWQTKIDDGTHFADIQNSEDAWQLNVGNGGFSRTIVLIEADVLPSLLERWMRINAEHYEFLLVFEDSFHQRLMFYHVWIPIAELYFDPSGMFQFHVLSVSESDHNNIVTMTLNDAKNPNWQLNIDQKFLAEIQIKSNVMFAALHSKNLTRQSIVAMHLSGLPFFDEQLVGYEYDATTQMIELVPCLYHAPLIIAERWFMGCNVQQRVRYYFPE